MKEHGHYRMEIIFLGTNGWYDTKTGNTICTLIKTKKCNIILDAGNGFYKADRYIAADEQKPLYLFLSHFHLDHIAGLHILNKFKFSRGFTICGPLGTKSILEMIINQPFSAPLDRLSFPIDIQELPDTEKKFPFKVRTGQLFHTTLTLGYRIESEHKVVAYVTDTGYCQNAVKLARNADILIAECAYKSGQFCESWPHLNPESAARIAKEASAKRLVLTHFDAEIYKTVSARKIAESIAQRIFNNTRAAIDTMCIEI